MKKLNFSRVALVLFLIALTAFLIGQNMAKPRILVLHSYNTDFSWVRDIDKGIRRQLEGKPYKVRWHYMDTKRHPTKDYMERAGATARKMIDEWQPDVIIAMDDDAQQYATKYYIDNPRIKIVFAGVNRNAEYYGYDKANNVTGVLERINYDAVKDILFQTLPEDKRRVIHISDDSATSQGIHREIEAVNWAPLEFIRSTQCRTFDDWKKAILDAENSADFLLLTHYHTLRRHPNSDEVVPPKEVIEWTNANSRQPGVSFWGFYVEDGGMMAVALSPAEQGEVATNMAIDIIDKGMAPRSISVYTSRFFVIYMRGAAINERMTGMKVPLVYEAFARATNHYYE